MPHMHRILQGEIRWPPPKWDSRVPATLVPDGAAPRTQESHPSTLCGLSAHIEWLDSRWMPPPSVATDLRAARTRTATHHARAERAGRDWAGLGVT